MGDWADESPSEEDDKNEIENELYSMFYYHSMSDGIPDELSKKYDVDMNDFGVTISLKDKSYDCMPNQNSSGQLSDEDESVIGRKNKDRFIDQPKGVKHCVREKRKNSVDKCVSEIQNDVVPAKVPESTPDSHQYTSRISRFQSSRYFSVESTNHNTPKNNFKYRNDNYSKSFYNNRSNVQPKDFFKKRFEHDASTSTPIVKRKSTYSNEPSTKRSKNQSQDLSTIKHNEDIIDLTKGLQRNRMKKIKNITPINKREDDNVITISSGSEYDSDSDLLITDSESEYEDEDESFNSILLNTSMPNDQDFYDVSVINIDYDWRQTSSPEGWTQSMKKFYNKPSKKLLNFDYNDIIQEIRSQGSSDWSICKADLHRFKNSRRIRCLRCQQEGHVKANCTKEISCHMCGTPGHISTKCPQKMCLKCGSKCLEVFPSGCVNCVNEENTACSACGLLGHNSSSCTDAWRSQSLVNKNKANKQRAGLKYCCNCAKSGHYYEDCRKISQPSSNSHGGDWKSFKAHFNKNRSPKRNKQFKDNDGSPSLNHKRSKFRIHSKKLKNLRNKKQMGLDFHFPNRKMKNIHVSKRISMLRKSNKKNMFKTARLSSTI